MEENDSDQHEQLVKAYYQHQNGYQDVTFWLIRVVGKLTKILKFACENGLFSIPEAPDDNGVVCRAVSRSGWCSWAHCHAILNLLVKELKKIIRIKMSRWWRRITSTTMDIKMSLFGYPSRRKINQNFEVCLWEWVVPDSRGTRWHRCCVQRCLSCMMV